MTHLLRSVLDEHSHSLFPFSPSPFCFMFMFSSVIALRLLGDDRHGALGGSHCVRETYTTSLTVPVGNLVVAVCVCVAHLAFKARDGAHRLPPYSRRQRVRWWAMGPDDEFNVFKYSLPLHCGAVKGLWFVVLCVDL